MDELEGMSTIAVQGVKLERVLEADEEAVLKWMNLMTKN